MFHASKPSYTDAGPARMTMLKIIAMIMGGIAAFLATSPFYTASRDWIYSYAYDNYGEFFAHPVTWIWFLVCGAISYGGGYLATFAIRQAIILAVASMAINRR
jgi:hypothetical protein